MKTKVLVLATLLLGGFIFTSCQKDNALLEDNATGQSFAKENYTNQQESVWVYQLKNYPDPFITATTIEYKLARTAFVKLIVFSSDSRWKKVLVKEIQTKGTQTVEFDASGLPAGEYTAEVKVGPKVLADQMIKINGITLQEEAERH